MSPKKSENEPGKKPYNFRPGGRGGRIDDNVIDASPGERPGDQGKGSPNFNQSRAKQELSNLTEHKAWKQSTGAANQMWTRYVAILQTSFTGMTRPRQIQLITNASQIVSMGLTAVALSLFYRFLPIFARVIIVPAALVAAWWLGTNVIAAALVERFNQYLNKDE
jgi:hypothetical protein